MEEADTLYFETIGKAAAKGAMNATAKAIPKAWAVKAKAYAAAKAPMPEGPPQVRDEYNHWISNAARKSRHQVIFDRALADRRKAKAEAKAHPGAQGGAAELNSMQTSDAIYRAEVLSKNVEGALAAARINLKRQRQGEHPASKVDSKEVARDIATAFNNLEHIVDRKLERFMDDRGL